MNIKKVVSGKTYNTNTAKEIGYVWNGLSLDDTNYFYEGLWQRFDGELFILHQAYDALTLTPKVTIRQNLTIEDGLKWSHANLEGGELTEAIKFLERLVY